MYNCERSLFPDQISRDRGQAAHVLHPVAVGPRIDCGVEPKVRNLNVPVVGAAWSKRAVA